MMRSLTAASGMMGQQLSIDTMANNLPTSIPPATKSRVDFQDLLYQSSVCRYSVAAGAQIPTGIQTGQRQASGDPSFTQGTFKQRTP